MTTDKRVYGAFGPAWTQTVESPTAEYQKIIQLFSDCFTFSSIPLPIDEYRSSLIYQSRDNTRYIASDNIFLYYLKTCNIPTPKFYRTENLNLTEQERDDMIEKDMSVESFVSLVTDIPFNPSAVNKKIAGENRVVYLIGEMGSGKSFLISRMIAEIEQIGTDKDDFKLLPIRVCMEELTASCVIESIGQAFFSYITEIIKDKIESLMDSAKVKYLISCYPSFTPDSKQDNIRSLKRFIQCCHEQKIRFVFFFDNIDPFHYVGSKYIFFKGKIEEIQRRIHDVIIDLIRLVSVDPIFRSAGICCLIASRKAIARDAKIIGNAAGLDIDIFSGHQVFQLSTIDPIEIVNSRLDLFSKCYKVVQGHVTMKWDALGAIKSLADFSDSSRGRSGFNNIWKMGHHGHRSLMRFIAKLKIELSTDSEVFDRLIAQQSRYLELLYISNGFRKYSQSQNHFPNMYLVDANVDPRNAKNLPEVKLSHRESYWLKFLIMKYVWHCSRTAIDLRASDIIEKFVSAGFEDCIVRLALGSLCDVNESRCCELRSVSDFENPSDDLVVLTSRGDYLIGAERGAPYCLSFLYLEMVIDDPWLSLPEVLSRELRTGVHLNYIMQKEQRHVEGLQRYLVDKIPSVLKFIVLLEKAAKSESQMIADEQITKLFPDMALVMREVQNQISAILAKLGGSARSGGKTISMRQVTDIIGSR
jgi:hypothetical protein